MRLGEYLVQQKLISKQDLEKALEQAQLIHGRLGSRLVRLGVVSEDKLIPKLSQFLDIPTWNEEIPRVGFEQCIAALNLSLAWCQSNLLIPFYHNDVLCYVARFPNEPIFKDYFSAVDEFSGKFFLARTADLIRFFDGINNSKFISNDNAAHLKELAEEAPIVELVNNIFAQAVESSASDIHLEPRSNSFQIRFRIDGVMRTLFEYSVTNLDAVTSRIKLISELDIAERRLPQDGRIGLRVGGKDLDVRVSTIPGVYGESIVMRLLEKKELVANLADTGMLVDHEVEFLNMINEPHGIVLVTGPTGSGKSTTLYNSIRLVDDRSRKIITVEDPVEYKIDGITQIQVKDEIGMSFAAGLRAILRHDPDVIMVGEIRDQETAKIAIQSALTGHMVFSTLHTNDAASAATRLIDMGIEPFLIASALTGVLAQRLLRKLCSCAQPIEIPAIYATAYSEILIKNPRLTANSYRFREAVGCDLCSQTGYSGRMGLFELMKVDEQIRQAIVIKKPATEIAAIAFLAGNARTLFEDGLIKAGMGLTSIEEVCRVAVNAVAEPM